ncbi:MAG: DUF4252 domain-containing protein [Opitutae bacterium]|nr:DUF4252 domain-containing protein [Opitutae bacterium]
MKNLLRSTLAAAALSAAFSVSASAASANPEPGFVDMAAFLPAAKGEYVEVNLSPGLLKFVAKLAAHEDADAAELIGSLKRVRVNVVKMDDANRADTLAKIEAVRRQLEGAGWTQVVTVRERHDGDNVDVHVKQHADESIEGLVVTVIDHQGEAVFVNLVGNIRAEQLTKIADKLDIQALKKVHVKTDRKPRGKEQS